MRPLRLAGRTRTPSRATTASGLGLVELLVALTIGLVLLTGVLSIFSTSLQSNRFATQNSRLNQELNGAMELMVRDIRRAGYWGTAENGIGNSGAYAANPFITDVISANADGGINTSTTGCILFRYDRNDNGTLEDSERVGYRLSGNAVQMLTAATSGTHTCTGGTWESVTDTGLSSVTALTFAKTHVSTNPSSGVVCTRDITITLTGRLASDTTVTQTLTQIVRVRADWYGSSSSCPANTP